MIDLKNSPLSALTRYKQFILYRVVARGGSTEKLDKIPIHPRTGQAVANYDQTAWFDFDAAVEAARILTIKKNETIYVGFVLTPNDPFFLLDIDHCRNPDTEILDETARSLLNRFPHAAVEVSTSRTGLHIIGSAECPPHRTRDNKKLGLELYSSKRFIALTGLELEGDANHNCTSEITTLINDYFPPAINNLDTNYLADAWTTAPVPTWNGPEDDTILIERMLKNNSSRAIFGDKASLTDLWENKHERLIPAYPDKTGKNPYDRSRADAALAQHLAYWTGSNCERILRLMKQSKLARKKWERVDYLSTTILRACANQTKYLNDPKLPALVTKNETDNTPPEIFTGDTFLTIEQQLRLFSGCTYICDLHKVFTPGGNLLKPEQFRVMFGGFTFPMDLRNEKTCRNAWEAFTESQAFRARRVNASCFRPDLPPGEIVKFDGYTAVNTYWPVTTPRRPGDVTPFLKHAEKLIPDERDRTIFISYLAAIIQYPGIKFQWAPLMQGVEGNGKTLFTRCVAFAIGNKYSHFPKAAELAGKFNEWMYRKIFIAIEDIFVPEQKREIMEALKPMITGEFLEIEPKGRDKVTLNICCNFIINTNHRDGLRKNRNDRRIAPFFTPQQQKSDLKKYGLTPNYFKKLYDWLKHEYGYEIVSDYLHNYKIFPEFNPASGGRAPFTSSTEAAILAGLGAVEQEILEAIEQGIIGFRGGWISSIALDRLLERTLSRYLLPRTKRREILQGLNYDWHPSLPDGRINRTILPDGAKPKLFIHGDSPLRYLNTVEDVAIAYTLAQQLGDEKK